MGSVGRKILLIVDCRVLWMEELLVHELWMNGLWKNFYGLRMDYRLYYEWIVGEWIDEFILG